MGHEFCGTVIELGQNVRGFQVGDRCAVNPAMSDLHFDAPECEQCLDGKQNLCPKVSFYGLSQGGGGFAEQIVVKPVALIKLPDNVSLKLAGLAEPLAVAAHMVRISGFQSGQNALVLGAGPIGCALTLLLKAKGAKKIMVSEVAASRAAQAKAFGADLVVNPLAKEDGGNPVLNAVRDTMESGAHVSFDACGLQTTLDTAIECTMPGGMVFNVAIHDKALQINLNTLVMGEKRLMGGICYTKEDFEEAVHVLSTRGEEAARLISSVVPLKDAIKGGFHELIDNTASHVKILIKASEDVE